MLKVVFDRVAAFFGLLLLFPFFAMIALIILLGDGLPIFYFQERVGKNEKPFYLIKFRTMKRHADRLGKLSIGERDPRVTRIGYYLRKYKIDELPQLFNVLFGTMSIVGPRPEVAEFVHYYSRAERAVLDVKPGITDYASLHYFEESTMLAESAEPRQTYISEVMPAKLAINLAYLQRRSFFEDLKIIALTILRIIR